MTDRGQAHERHDPIMRDRILDLLAPALSREDAVHVDATLGMGGHAEGVLQRFAQCRVIGIDRDREALELAGERLAGFGDRFTAVHATNDQIARVVLAAGLQHVDGIVFDLGVSSLQLDEEDRGFAYRVDAPLDMRMDQTRGLTAANVLNEYPVEELTRILRDYGEERFARKIAAAIVRARATEPFTTSARLVELLRRVIPVASQRQSGHPAKRTFQALRIEVNDELGGLAVAVAWLIGRLLSCVHACSWRRGSMVPGSVSPGAGRLWSPWSRCRGFVRLPGAWPRPLAGSRGPRRRRAPRPHG